MALTVADVQAALDAWWPNLAPAQLRLNHLRAFVANRWRTPDAGYIRISLVAGADGFGTALRFEVETQAHAVITRELRPTAPRADGLTLDDVEDFGTTNNRANGITTPGSGFQAIKA